MGIEPQSPAEGRAATTTRRDLFISYAGADLDTAHALRVALEASGYSCWMAPDDVVGPGSWADQIAAAVAGCRAMLVLVSSASVASRHVPKEAELAFGRRLPLIPVRLDEVAPSGSLEYLLSLTQWFDLFPGPLEAHVEELLARIGRDLDGRDATVSAPRIGPAAHRRPPAPGPPPPLIRPRSGARKLRRIVVALIALTTLAISLLSFLRADALIVLQALDLRVDPNPARAGSAATAIGGGWATGSPVEIQWGAAYGTVVGTGTSTDSGSFAITFNVPAGAAPGDHQVWACQYAAGTDCSPGNEFKSMNSTLLTVSADTPPVANPDRLTTAMGASLVIPDAVLISNDGDPDGDPLCRAVRIIDGPGRGSLDRITDTDLVYTPGAGFAGTDGFTYRVCDAVNNAWSNVATVAIDVVFEGSVSVQPGSGPPGTRVRVTGRSFPIDAAVEVRFEDRMVTTSAVDGTGGFVADFEIPEVPPGSSTVTACVTGVGVCASTGFEVVAPTTTTTPTTTTPTTTTPTTTTPTTTTPTTTTPTTTTPPPTTPTTTTPTPTTAPAAGPIAVDDAATAEPDSPIVIDVLANDHHPGGELDPATLRIVTPPEHGSAEVTAPGLITYVAGGAATDTDRLDYEICDTRGICAVARVIVRLQVAPHCPADGVTVESFTIDPQRAAPQDAVEVTLRAGDQDPAICPLPIVRFLFDGAAWGAPVAFVDGSITIGRSIPADAVAGDHTITAVAEDSSVQLARRNLAVTPAPVESGPSDGTAIWRWIPIGIAAVGAAWFVWRRRVLRARRLADLRAAATSAAERAAALDAQARALEAELDECELRHHRSTLILPTAFVSGEDAGGATPYLLDYENPSAPLQDDGRHGWYYPRRKEPIRAIVIHTPGGLALPEASADHVARYLATCRSPASAHAVVDARGVITLLPESYTALHVPAANGASLGLIVCPGDDPDDQRAALNHAARWCRVMADAHGVPMTRIDADAWRMGGIGIMGHSDVDAGANDPAGPGNTAFPWATLLEADPGPSTFPGAVPVRRRPGPDPCADERQRATEARRRATEARTQATDAPDRFHPVSRAH